MRRFSLLRTIDLHHDGTVALSGVAPDGTLYVEESYDEDAWVAQHVIDPAGRIVQTVDEDFGRAQGFSLLPLPDDLMPPGRIQRAGGLRFSGPRLRGLRATDRIDTMVLPLDISTKMALVQSLDLAIPPPLLLGLAESVPLAEAALGDVGTLICRRVRFAYGLTTPVTGPDGLPYDYDTHTLYFTQWLPPDADAADLLADFREALPQCVPWHPVDCLAHKDRLLVADAGDGQRPSRVQILSAIG